MTKLNGRPKEIKAPIRYTTTFDTELFERIKASAKLADISLAKMIRKLCAAGLQS